MCAFPSSYTHIFRHLHVPCDPRSMTLLLTTRYQRWDQSNSPLYSVWVHMKQWGEKGMRVLYHEGVRGMQNYRLTGHIQWPNGDKKHREWETERWINATLVKRGDESMGRWLQKTERERSGKWSLQLTRGMRDREGEWGRGKRLKETLLPSLVHDSVKRSLAPC